MQTLATSGVSLPDVPPLQKETFHTAAALQRGQFVLAGGKGSTLPLVWKPCGLTCLGLRSQLCHSCPDWSE